jgi:hypothetical protein
MSKAKFRDHVRRKGDVAMKNEVLWKILCHNICCVIQSMYELGIESTFYAESSIAEKVHKIYALLCRASAGRGNLRAPAS